MSIQKIKFLKSLVYNGAKNKKLEITDVVLDRISLELSIIENKGFADYFILYSRIIEVCNEFNLVRSPGRGSAAGSLINYCLDITKLNPLNHSLIFEKFINYKRTRFPDIDIDIPKGYQNKVINRLKQRYPEYNTYFVAFSPQRETNYEDVFYNSVPYKKHPYGIIITKENVTDSVFNHKNQEFYLVTDILKDKAYHNKIDVVELEYLNRLQLIAEQIGNEYHPFNIPIDEKAVFALLSSGENENIFQLNTALLSKILRDFKPQNINDLSIINATYRPGLIELIPRLITNKSNGYEGFQNPLINKLLEETYGILVYQETFLEIMKQIAGFNYEDANIWRVKLFKSKSDDAKNPLREFDEVFTKKIQYLPQKDIVKLKEMIENNLKMAYIKSHSLSYSLIGYWGAYYKTFFNSEFEKIFNQEANYEAFELYKS